MAKNSNGKDYISAIDEAKDGTFFKINSTKYFLKIKQRLAIDKVVFSFVKVGTQGKEKIEVWLQADEFDFLCDMILDDTLRKDINNDKGDYPNAWVRQSGHGGSKKVAIGSGKTMPIVIQGHNAKNKTYMMLGIDRYERLMKMAREWRLISKKYFDEIRNACITASYEYDEEVDEASEEQLKEEKVLVKMRVVSKAVCKERKSTPGNFAMEAAEFETGEKKNIVFPAEEIKKMSEKTWNTLLERSANKEIPLDFTGNFEETEEGKNNEEGKIKVYIFKGFAQ